MNLKLQRILKHLSQKFNANLTCTGKLQKWVLCLILMFGSWLFTAVWAPAEEVVDRIVAVVNNDIITYLEMQRELKPYEKRLKSMGYDEEKERQMRYKLQRDVIYRLIDQKLADQEIKKKQHFHQ